MSYMDRLCFKLNIIMKTIAKFINYLFPFSFLIILLYKSEGFSIIMCVAYYYSIVSVAINLFCLSFPKVLNCEYYYLRL